MSMSDEKVAGWRYKFETAERKRIRYWWTGSGKKCMSQDPFYCRLNEMCSRIATIRIVPELKSFINDTNNGSTIATKLLMDTKGLTGGKRWAAALCNYHGICPGIAQLAQKSSEKKLQKVCTLMQALDPVPLKLLPDEPPLQEQPLSIKLCKAVQTTALLLQMNAPFLCGKDPEFVDMVGEFIQDAMGKLWESLLKGESGLGEELAKRLEQDAMELEKQFVERKAENATDRATNLADALAGVTKTAALAMAAWGQHDLNGLAGKLNNTSQAFRGARQAVGVFDLAEETLRAKGSPWKFGGKMAARVAFSLAVTSFYIVFAVGAFDNWKYMHHADRGATILQSIRAGGQLLEQGGQMWKSIATFRNFETWAWRDAMRFENTALAAGEIQAERICVELAQRQGIDQLCKLQRNDILKQNPNARRALQTVENELRAATRPVDELAHLPNAKSPSGWFNHLAKVGKFIMGMIAVALIAFVSWQMISKWNDLHGTEFGLQLTSTIVQVVACLIDLFVLCAPATWLAGTAGVVLAWAGPILVIIGAALMLAMFFIERAKPPPLAEPEIFIRDNKDALLKDLDEVPTPVLTWTATRLLKPEQQGTQKVIGSNNSRSDIALRHINISISAGNTGDALFGNTSFITKGSPTKDGAGTVSLEGPGALQVGQGTTQNADPGHSVTSYNISVKPAGLDPESNLVVKPVRAYR
ncbi:hypothetical protein ACKRZS_000177 [Fusarium odoratissimum]